MKKIFFTMALACITWMANAAQHTELNVQFPKMAAFNEEAGFGYDMNTSWDGKATTPFFFSVNVPDGNYRVTVTLGSKKRAAHTTVRCECRRLFIENEETKKGQLIERTFVVNKRSAAFINEKGEADVVALKPRERNGMLHWDNKLTIEINGDAPAIQSIRIERDTIVPTLYLCGNSTVVDQDQEPWASWGQMIPRFLNDSIAVANYAESGLAAASFIGQKRWAKIHSLLKPGDYVLLEFGHNDQKADNHPGNGAYYAFSHDVKTMIDLTKKKGATFMLCTPTMRRMFKGGEVQATHKDYPDAIRDIARREGLLCIDLQALTKVFYEALGRDKSTKAFVHYPANTFPKQEKALADNTHFNTYGAYQIAKMVANGLLNSNLPLKRFVSPIVKDYNPAQPDDVDAFHWCPCPFVDITKPDGN